VSQALFVALVAVLLAVALLAILLFAAMLIDYYRAREAETIPDPDVVRYLRPSGNVDRVEDEAGEA